MFADLFVSHDSMKPGENYSSPWGLMTVLLFLVVDGGRCDVMELVYGAGLRGSVVTGFPQHRRHQIHQLLGRSRFPSHLAQAIGHGLEPFWVI